MEEQNHKGVHRLLCERTFLFLWMWASVAPELILKLVRYLDVQDIVQLGACNNHL